MKNKTYQKIQLPKINDSRGNLTVIEGMRDIPFEIKRIFYIYDVPSDSGRAAHANKKLEQLMIAMSGSFEILLDDGHEQKTVILDSCQQGLYIPGMVWREINKFSPGAVCMVLASDYYDSSDYYREYEAFLEATRK